MRNRGLIYRCFGEKYSEGCYHSIISLRISGGNCSNYPVIVFDFNKEPNIWIEKIKFIPNVEVRSIYYEGDYATRIDREHRLNTLSSPMFEVTLNLDADTLVMQDPSALFETAENYGCARILDFGEKRIPSIYGDEMVDQLNAGVFCYTKAVALQIYEQYKEIVESGYFQHALSSNTLKGSGRYRTGMNYDKGNLLIDRDQPLLNTIIKKIGLEIPETILPPRFNSQTTNDDNVIFHPYFRMRNDKRAMTIYRDIQELNQKILSFPNGTIYLYFGSPINGFKWNKICFCVNEDYPIQPWIIKSKLPLCLKFETWEQEAKSIGFVAEHIDKIETIYGFGRIDKWKGLKTVQFNEILKRLII